MGFPKSLSVFFALLIMATTNGYTIDVGGSKGWTLNPPENYNLWAARMRFSVNDTLHFICNKKSSHDSVLVVSRDDYDKCNNNNPIIKMKGNKPSFKFERSGPFYFITGNKSNCDHGQKMHLIVLAVRRNYQQPSAAPIIFTTSPAPSPARATPPIPTGGTTNSPADLNSASSVLCAASTVSFVIISLTLIGFIALA